MTKSALATLNSQKEESCYLDHRCCCGSLLAKITPQGIELKCRKCKRLQLIPVHRIATTEKQ